MAHIVIEYSSNLSGELDVQQLVNAVHEAALATGVFPSGGLRTRAYATQCYRIADGHVENAFVHFGLRVGHGRDLATRQAACERIFATVCEQLKTFYERRPLGISLEMQELHAELNYKKNNLHQYVKSRQDLQRKAAE